MSSSSADTRGRSRAKRPRVDEQLPPAEAEEVANADAETESVIEEPRKLRGGIIPELSMELHHQVPHFLRALWELTSNPAYTGIVSWNAKGNAMIIHDVGRLEAEVLPNYFKHGKYPSFLRQLNLYSFFKTNSDPTSREFTHPRFNRAHPELLLEIHRKAASSSTTATASAAAAVASIALEKAAAAAASHPHSSSSLASAATAAPLSSRDDASGDTSARSGSAGSASAGGASKQRGKRGGRRTSAAASVPARKTTQQQQHDEGAFTEDDDDGQHQQQLWDDDSQSGAGNRSSSRGTKHPRLQHQQLEHGSSYNFNLGESSGGGSIDGPSLHPHGSSSVGRGGVSARLQQSHAGPLLRRSGPPMSSALLFPVAPGSMGDDAASAAAAVASLGGSTDGAALFQPSDSGLSTAGFGRHRAAAAGAAAGPKASGGSTLDDAAAQRLSLSSSSGVSRGAGSGASGIIPLLHQHSLEPQQHVTWPSPGPIQGQGQASLRTNSFPFALDGGPALGSNGGGGAALPFGSPGGPAGRGHIPSFPHLQQQQQQQLLQQQNLQQQSNAALQALESRIRGVEQGLTYQGAAVASALGQARVATEKLSELSGAFDRVLEATFAALAHAGYGAALVTEEWELDNSSVAGAAPPSAAGAAATTSTSGAPGAAAPAPVAATANTAGASGKAVVVVPGGSPRTGGLASSSSSSSGSSVAHLRFLPLALLAAAARSSSPPLQPQTTSDTAPTSAAAAAAAEISSSSTLTSSPPLSATVGQPPSSLVVPAALPSPVLSSSSSAPSLGLRKGSKQTPPVRWLSTLEAFRAATSGAGGGGASVAGSGPAKQTQHQASAKTAAAAAASGAAAHYRQHPARPTSASGAGADYTAVRQQRALLGDGGSSSSSGGAAPLKGTKPPSSHAADDQVHTHEATEAAETLLAAAYGLEDRQQQKQQQQQALFPHPSTVAQSDAAATSAESAAANSFGSTVAAASPSSQLQQPAKQQAQAPMFPSLLVQSSFLSSRDIAALSESADAQRQQPQPHSGGPPVFTGGVEDGTGAGPVATAAGLARRGSSSNGKQQQPAAAASSSSSAPPALSSSSALADAPLTTTGTSLSRLSPVLASPTAAPVIEERAHSSSALPPPLARAPSWQGLKISAPTLAGPASSSWGGSAGAEQPQQQQLSVTQEEALQRLSSEPDLHLPSDSSSGSSSSAAAAAQAPSNSPATATASPLADQNFELQQQQQRASFWGHPAAAQPGQQQLLQTVTSWGLQTPHVAAPG